MLINNKNREYKIKHEILNNYYIIFNSNIFFYLKKYRIN